MNRISIFTSFRGWSWILGSFSLLPIFVAIYVTWQASLWAAERDRNGEFVCGTGLVAVLFLCALLACLTGFFAVACGVAGYLRSPKPRPMARMLELFAVGNVFVLGAIGFLLIFFLNAFKSGGHLPNKALKSDGPENAQFGIKLTRGPLLTSRSAIRELLPSKFVPTMSHCRT